MATASMTSCCPEPDLVDVLVNNGLGGFGSPAAGSPTPDVGSSTSAGTYYGFISSVLADMTSPWRVWREL